MHVGGKLVSKTRISTLDEALRVRQSLLDSQAVNKRIPSGKQQKHVRVKPGIVLASSKYFATCNIDGKHKWSSGYARIEDAETELLCMKAMQAECKKARYENKYHKASARPRTEEQLHKKRMSQNKYAKTSKHTIAKKKRSDSLLLVRSEKKAIAADKAAKTYKLDRLVQRTRDRIYRLAMKKNTKKPGKTIDMLGCSRDHFRAHLESQLRGGESMDDHTLDHIFPCSAFDLSDSDNFRNCFHYSNFQPLTLKENCSKQSKLPTKAMAQKVPSSKWPASILMEHLPDKYDGWSTELRM